MTAVYIILAILTFLAVLLFCPVSLKVLFNESFSLKVKYLVFSYKYPSSAKPKQKAEKSEEKSEPLKRMIKKQGILQTLQTVAEIGKIFAKQLKELLQRSVIKKFNLKIKICGEDPATTAIEYGAVCSLVYPLVGFMSAAVDFEKENVGIECDFNGDESTVDFEAVLKTKLIFVLIFAVSFLVKYISENKNILSIKEGANK